MVAAENGALPGGKVGGVGDVIRDLPHALAEAGWQPTVLTPAYGLFNRLPGAQPGRAIDVTFAGARQTAEVWRLPSDDARIAHRAIEHPLLSPDGPGKIYCNDDADRPFATDAGKFAFFSAAVTAFVQQSASAPDVVHLHDWHTALYLVLRAFDPTCRPLRDIRTVFTIHNLAYQGIRPLAGDPSSLAMWFPALRAPAASVGDPRYADCINPMAAAIRLADRLNTVSPTYAREIRQPNDPSRGFRGGEGLEADLERAARQRRLTGILNGCEYPRRSRRRPGWNRVLDAAGSALDGLPAAATGPLQRAALQRIAALPRRRPRLVLTSVGRLTEQKAALFLQPTTRGRSALEAILAELGGDGVLVLLGSGDPALEAQVGAIAAAHRNFLFLCGYFEPLAELLYATGDLFLMPSSFEPCGISQMLAMRAGQPCLAHAVGGLRDTIDHDVNGFLFDGDTPTRQADRFVAAVRRARMIRFVHANRWRRLRAGAAAERFSWKVAAERYLEDLYAVTTA